MHTIALPEATQGLRHATVRRWLKSAGDAVAAGEVLVELETEDALLQIETEREGELGEILAPAGTTLAVGAALCQLATSSPTPAPSIGESPVTQSPESAPPLGGAVVPVVMPQAGNSMEEGTIIEWKVNEGDRIEAGQVICEIETDKATLDYEAPAAGRLARIVAGNDETVPVKQPIAYLAEDDADVDVYLSAQGDGSAEDAAAPLAERPPLTTEMQAVASAPTTAAVAHSGRVKASPAARRLAQTRGLDISRLASGSGPGGRILSSDLDAAPPLATDGTSVRRPLSKMRRAIAVNLQLSKQTVPHFYVRLTVDADPLFAFYREHKPATACTVNDVIVLAVGKVVGELPGFRCQFDGDAVVESPHADIGIAVGVEEGLVVPVLKGVERMDLEQVAAASRPLVENARNGRVDHMGEGTFTISNLGMFGVEEFAAIINPPESGILAVSAVREDVIVKNGTLRVGRVMTMTLSVDHRVVDGVLAARFVARLKELLEDPAALLG